MSALKAANSYESLGKLLTDLGNTRAELQTQRGSLVDTYLAGRPALTTTLSGRSPLTSRTENVTVYATRLRSGGVVYAATVVPADEASQYSQAFRNALSSMRLMDQ